MGPKKKKKDDPPPEMGEGSKISSLPSFVSRHLQVTNQTTGAVRVWFASNNLKVIPEHIYKNEELAAFLDELLVTDGHVKKMQPYIDQCENLTKLVMHNNLLKAFPPAFTQLQKLKHLDFGKNTIKRFPATGKVKTLETLIADHNNFKKIPANVFQNDNLRSVDLSHNILKALPKTIYKKPLAFVDASHNSMETLPKIPVKGEQHINYLNVSHCRIKEFPLNFNKLNCLSRFNISHNQLSTLSYPSQSGTLGGDLAMPIFITHLNLSHNFIKHIDKSLLKLKGLVILDVSHNELVDVPEELYKLKCLTELYINNNSIDRLPKDIHKLSRLKILDASFNSITDIDGVESLPFCSIFRASHNEITKLPEEMRAMSCVAELDLSHNKIETIPTSLGRVGSLKYLNLSHNCITIVPEELGIAQVLEKLDLSHNELPQLPWELRKWRMLTHLHLNNNQLTFLHKNFHGMFNQLQVLDLKENALVDLSIPPTVKELSISNNSPHHLDKVLNKSLIMLEKLCISGLELSEIPANVVTKYRLIQHLDISKNQLTSIPDGLIHIMKQLRHFDCSFNDISELPADIQNLKYLQHFNCSHNQIKALPDNFLRCPLVYLDVSSNKISKLTMPEKPNEMSFVKPFPLAHLNISANQIEELWRENIHWLGSLRVLNAQANLLTWIHPDVTCLYRLETINLAENDLMYLPKDFTTLTSLQEVLYDFQQRVKREPRKPCNVDEVIFIMTGKDPSKKDEGKKKKKDEKTEEAPTSVDNENL